MDTSHDMRIIADPSALTMALVQRELHAVERVLEVRLDAMDKAQSLFETNLTRVPTEVDKAIALLHSLVWEHIGTVENAVKALHILTWEHFASIESRFGSIQLQFTERDTRTEQIAKGNETALTAALNAAKEAVSQQNIAFGQATSKAEAGFIKQMDQLVALFQTGMKSLDEKISAATKTSDDKIANLEKQITMLIGTGAGQHSAQATHQTSSSFNVSLIGMIGGIIFGAIGIIFAIMKS